MTPVIAILDDFFDYPELATSQLTEQSFGEVMNPKDGVTYFGISTNILTPVTTFIERRMASLLGHRMRLNTCFFRLMTGEMPPSMIHADHVMGDYSLHVYLSQHTKAPWGTQFWRHEEFGTSYPDTFDGTIPEFVERTKPATAWSRELFVEAKYNRACVHDSKLWHSAVPAWGFGSGLNDGRLVLTTFFSKDDR